MNLVSFGYTTTVFCFRLCAQRLASNYCQSTTQSYCQTQKSCSLLFCFQWLQWNTGDGSSCLCQPGAPTALASPLYLLCTLSCLPPQLLHHAEVLYMLAGLLSKLAMKVGWLWNVNLNVTGFSQDGASSLCIIPCTSHSGPGFQRQSTTDSSQPLISSDCVCQCNETPDSLPSTSQGETYTDRHTNTSVLFYLMDQSLSNTIFSFPLSFFHLVLARPRARTAWTFSGVSIATRLDGFI